MQAEAKYGEDDGRNGKQQETADLAPPFVISLGLISLGLVLPGLISLRLSLLSLVVRVQPDRLLHTTSFPC